MDWHTEIREDEDQLKREVISISDEKPFKDVDVVRADISRCSWVAAILSVLSFLFVIVGVVGDFLDMTLGLEPMSWFLLAIVVALNAFLPQMNSLLAKLLFGMEFKKK